MDFNKWMNEKLPEVVNLLEQNIGESFDSQIEDGLDLAGRNEIYKILDNILAVLFPGSFSKEKLSREDINFYLSDMLRHLSFKLGKHVRDVFRYRC